MELRVSSFLDEKYIPSYRDRMDFFRRVSNIKRLEHLEDLKLELFDRYGAFTSSMHDLFRLVTLRIQGYWCGIKRFQQISGAVKIEFHQEIEQDILNGMSNVYRNKLEINPRFKDRLLLDSSKYSGTALLQYLEKFFCDEHINTIIKSRD